MQGDLFNHESLVNAIKQVDVVISTVGHTSLADQDKIIAAIKEAGNVKVTLFIYLIHIILKMMFFNVSIFIFFL